MDNNVQQSIDLVHPNGQIYTVPRESVQQAMAAGYKVPTQDQLTEAAQEAQYGDRPFSAAGLGVLKSVAPFGLGVGALTGSGLATEQGLQQLEQRNPASEITGEVGGLFVPSPIGLGSIASKAGKAVEEGAKAVTKLANASNAGKAVEEGAKAVTKLSTSSKIGSIVAKTAAKAAGSAIEGVIYSGSHVVNEAVLGDPNEVAESALSEIGAGALWGAGIGGVLGLGGVAVPAIVKKAKSIANNTWNAFGLGNVVDKVADTAKEGYATLSSVVSGKPKEDILAAITNRGTEAAPLDSSEIAANLQKHFDAMESAKKTALSDIRPEETERLITNVDPDMAKGQFQQVYDKLKDSIDEMRSEPELYPGSYARQLEQIKDGLVTKLNGEPSSPEVFRTLNQLKQTLDTKIPYEKVPNAAAQNAIGVIRDLRGAVKDSLEDTNVWGVGGARQAQFNGALSDYLKSANAQSQKGDFVKQFMYKSRGNQLKIDPTKVESFLKNTQTTKGIKSAQALAGFIDSSGHLLNQIEESYKALPEQTFDKQAVSDLISKNAGVIEQNQRQAILNRLSRGAGGEESSAEPIIAGYVAHAAGLSHPVVGSIAAAAEALRNPGQTIQRLAKLEETVKSVTDKITRGAKALIKPTYNVADYTKGYVSSKLAQMSVGKFNKISDEVQDLANNPAKLVDKMHANTEVLAPHAPYVTNSLQEAGGRALGFLASKLPQRPNQGPLAPKIEPSKAELAIFGRYYQYVEKPLSILKEAEAGGLTHEGVEVLSQVYPALYSKIKSEVTQQLMSNTREIPYTRKMMLSLLMGQDMDGTMTPQAIQSNQALVALSGAQSDAKDAAMAGKPKVRKTGLDKLTVSNRALTAQQASAQRTGKA
jgi:hypothetical protein